MKIFKILFCKICKTNIKINKKIIGFHFGNPKSIFLSENGINFKNCWFCNNCWKDIINYTDEEKNKYVLDNEDKKYLKS